MRIIQGIMPFMHVHYLARKKKTKYLSAIAKNRLRNTHPSSFMSDGLICASFEMFGVLDSNEVIAEIEPSELNVGMAARRCCLSWLGGLIVRRELPRNLRQNMIRTRRTRIALRWKKAWVSVHRWAFLTLSDVDGASSETAIGAVESRSCLKST